MTQQDKEEQQKRLNLSIEEAYALLALCLTSPLDADSQGVQAVSKLTEHCKELDRPTAPEKLKLDLSDAEKK